MARDFQFEVFRLNTVDQDVTDFLGSTVRSDAQIAAVLKAMARPDFDVDVETGKAVYIWSVREFQDFDAELPDGSGRILQVVLSRSVVEQTGQTVTDSGIENAVTQLTPPPANSMLILVYLDRHIVAAEHNALLMSSERWRGVFREASRRAAQSMDFRSELVLEPIPEREELLTIFRSFPKLVRLKLKVRLPNPELSRHTKRLYDELCEGGIREYTQDMKNPNGLNTDEGTLPHSSVSLAEAGYKDGEVTFVGIKGGRKERRVTGKQAARGKLDGFRDYMRGLKDNAKAKETRMVLDSLMKEIDRIAPREGHGESVE
jgi:hypothetical protein